MRPTRGQAGHLLSLYSALLRMGFTQPTGHPAAGELLPHHFTLTPSASERYVSVALSVGSPLLGVTQHPARRSSDFPPRYYRGGHPVYLTRLQCSGECEDSQWAVKKSGNFNHFLILHYELKKQ